VLCAHVLLVHRVALRCSAGWIYFYLLLWGAAPTGHQAGLHTLTSPPRLSALRTLALAQEFLERVAEMFEVVVFTASQKVG
jgi:hypothetical protein